MTVVLFFELCWKVLSCAALAEPPEMVSVPPSDLLVAASSQTSSHTTFSRRQLPLMQWMPSAALALMRTFLSVALLSVKIGCCDSLPPAQEVPTVMPPQSIVVLLIALPGEQDPVATTLEVLDALDFEDVLLAGTLLDELELHMGRFQLAGFTHVASHGTLPQHDPDDAPHWEALEELPLPAEVVAFELLDDAGVLEIEHSLVPPAMRPPNVASLHTKLPDSVL